MVLQAASLTRACNGARRDTSLPVCSSRAAMSLYAASAEHIRHQTGQWRYLKYTSRFRKQRRKQAGLQRSATRRNSKKLRSRGLRLPLSLFLKNVAGELRNAFAQLPQNGPENNTCNIHMSVCLQHVTAAVHASNLKQQEVEQPPHALRLSPRHCVYCFPVCHSLYPAMFVSEYKLVTYCFVWMPQVMESEGGTSPSPDSSCLEFDPLYGNRLFTCCI